MKRTYLYTALIAFAISLMTVVGFSYLLEVPRKVQIEHVSKPLTKEVTYSDGEERNLAPLDFTETARKVIDAVVHVKSTQSASQRSGEQPFQYRRLPDPFRDFFGDRFSEPWDNQSPMQPQPRIGTGSGVIISRDGYVVTNNHVIDNADDVEVTLHDNRTYKATVVGTDPTTDIALLQVRASELPSLAFINSDDVQVGEWVLAVGNPFSLNSTVTAGIVSAKGRNININRSRFAVESFIQTDAAINPGNSGGALVNVRGDLIGINTAIASPTGAYSGYGFAVPSNIVQKVVEDLINFGAVQRGVLGIMIRSIDGNFAKEKDLDVNQGVYVDSLLANSAAGEAGVQPGDIITSVDEQPIKTAADLQEIVARHRPGDALSLSVDRNGNRNMIEVVLSTPEGRTTLANREHKELLNYLGANLETINDDLANELNIHGGVKVTELYAGTLRRSTQMKEGFIITHVDGKRISSVDELAEYLDDKSGGVMLEGIYQDTGEKHYYAVGMDKRSM
ncbi:MAG: Do family serine endopeptidase [Saprospiraceae bacterium]|nr:Do family serine endopeptidase [Saprospiraceae bacterium]